MTAGGTRITGGSLRGETVHVLPGKFVRPMRARVRESLFAILGKEIERARVLDLYAGSGALGAEAISRGAVFVLYVERDRRVISVLEENRKRLGLTAQSEVAAIDLHRTTPPAEELFDIALIDPPFPDFISSKPGRDPWQVIERIAAACLVERGRIALEHPKGAEPPTSDLIEWEDARRYGDTELRLGRAR